MRFGKYAVPINGFGTILAVPLVNVLFLTFIIAALCLGYMSAGSGMAVNLPKALTSKTLNSSLVNIMVSPDGILMLNGRKASLDDISLFLKQLSGRRQTIVVNADKCVPLQDVISVFDAVRASGAGDCVVASNP